MLQQSALDAHVRWSSAGAAEAVAWGCMHPKIVAQAARVQSGVHK